MATAIMLVMVMVMVSMVSAYAFAMPTEMRLDVRLQMRSDMRWHAAISRLAFDAGGIVVFWRMDAEQLLTPEDVAKLLRLSEHTLASWRRTNSGKDLPWVEVGGVVRYRRRDIDAWLEARTKTAGSSA